MANLRKLTLEHNEKRGGWDLRDDKSDWLVGSFGTKKQAVAGGALRQGIGGTEASVKIQKMNGRFQEERTYPSSQDPKGSKG